MEDQNKCAHDFIFVGAVGDAICHKCRISEQEYGKQLKDTASKPLKPWEGVANVTGQIQDNCNHCGLKRGIDGYDPCIGELKGAKNACCGHGNVNSAYVQFDHDEYDQYPNLKTIEGQKAIDYISKHKPVPSDKRQLTPMGKLIEEMKELKMIRITDAHEDDTLVYYEADVINKLIKSKIPAEQQAIEDAHEHGASEWLRIAIDYKEHKEELYRRVASAEPKEDAACHFQSKYRQK